MIKLLAIIFLWLAAFLSWAQTNWHDPSLDGVNVNLGILDSDINGAFQNLPLRIAQTNTIETQREATLYGSNLYVWGGYTNNPPQQSNAVNRGLTIRALTNVWTNFTSFSTGMPLSNSFDGRIVGGTNTDWRIYLPGGAYVPMNVTINTGGYINPVFCSLIRSIILAIEYFCLFWLVAADLKKSVSDLLEQRQMEGSKQSILGTNVSAGMAAVYAVALTAAIVVGVTAVANYSFVGEARLLGSGSAIASHLQTLAAYPAWEVLTAFIPVVSSLIVFTSYLLFKYVFITPLFMMTRAIVLWMLV